MSFDGIISYLWRDATVSREVLVILGTVMVGGGEVVRTVWLVLF